MRALIAKEIRENLKWAALILALAWAALAFAIHAVEQTMGHEFLWLATAPGIVIVTSAAGGLLLGILQTALEAGRDRWAFLVHRPIPITRIFLAKALAGVGLLYAAVGLPLAYAAAWCAGSGRWAAPFYWDMALPCLIDLAAGAIYWCAGAAIGRREARWYGSRILPVGLPILCTILIIFVPEAWQALLVLALGIAVMGLAARGLFQAGGTWRPLPWPAKVALGIPVLVGLVFLAVLGLNFLEPFFQGRFRRSTQERAELRSDGSILFSRTDAAGAVTVWDEAGKEISTYQSEAAYEKAHPSAEALHGGIGNLSAFPASYRIDPRLWFSRVFWEDREIGFFCPREGIIRCYDLEKDRLVGFLGPEGFTETEPPAAARFRGSMAPSQRWSSFFLVLDQGVWQIQRRSVQRIHAGDPGDPILGVTSPWNFKGKSDQRFIAVLTRKAVTIVDHSEGKEIARLANPIDPSGLSYLRVGMLNEQGRYAFEYVKGWQEGRNQKLKSLVVLASADGKVFRKVDLPVQSYREEAKASNRAYGLLIAFVGGSGIVFMDLAEHWRSFNGTVLHHFLRGADSEGLSWLFIFLGGAASAALALVLGRRAAFGKTRQWGWALGCLIFGPMGLLLLIALEEWPAREPCPACGRLRVVDRDLCERCGAPFPPPGRDGTEIFEEPRAPAAAALVVGTQKPDL